MRVDLQRIADMVAPGSRVLDIGCGDGALLGDLTERLGCDARGIELDMQAATAAIGRGLSVMHGDADSDLAHYPDGAFDTVILSRTLHAVARPQRVLRQMLRIGRRAIVSFPNFGQLPVRLQLLTRGRMPVTRNWGRQWYETPNIHPCTIRDFFALCAEEGYVIEAWMAAGTDGARAPYRSVGLANLFAAQGLFLLRDATRS